MFDPSVIFFVRFVSGLSTFVLLAYSVYRLGLPLNLLEWIINLIATLAIVLGIAISYGNWLYITPDLVMGICFKLTGANLLILPKLVSRTIKLFRKWTSYILPLNPSIEVDS